MRSEQSMLTRAGRARVWRALAELSEFCEWFGVRCKSGRLAPGEQVDLICTVPGYEGVEFSIVVQEMTPERRLVWRWHPGVEGPGEDLSSEPMTTVCIELDDSDGGTRVHVLETGFEHLPEQRRAKAHAENNQGWAMQMQSLQRYL